MLRYCSRLASYPRAWLQLDIEWQGAPREVATRERCKQQEASAGTMLLARGRRSSVRPATELPMAPAGGTRSRGRATLELGGPREAS